MRNYYIIIILIAYIILGCSKIGEKNNEKIGFVVTPSKNDIYYKCGNKKANLDRNGKFSCDSFPIAFYMDGNEMGTITTIHNDGFVFPQDMQSFTIASR
jgi:hypothetical protein